MKVWRHHRTAADRDDLIAELQRAVPLAVDARACCCPARAVVTVMMPPTARRPHPVDLLLCGHHFRVSRASLQAAGATAYDATGLLIMAGTRPTSALDPQVGGFAESGACPARADRGRRYPGHASGLRPGAPGHLCFRAGRCLAAEGNPEAPAGENDSRFLAQILRAPCGWPGPGAWRRVGAAGHRLE